MSGSATDRSTSLLCLVHVFCHRSIGFYAPSLSSQGCRQYFKFLHNIKFHFLCLPKSFDGFINTTWVILNLKTRVAYKIHHTTTCTHRHNRCGFRGAWPPPPPIPNFEAQIFAATATPLRNVGKISLAPPYTNPGSAPAYMSQGVASGIPSTSASRARPGYSADLATCQLLATTTSRGRGCLALSQIAGPMVHARVLLARPIKG